VAVHPGPLIRVSLPGAALPRAAGEREAGAAPKPEAPEYIDLYAALGGMDEWPDLHEGQAAEAEDAGPANVRAQQARGRDGGPRAPRPRRSHGGANAQRIYLYGRQGRAGTRRTCSVRMVVAWLADAATIRLRCGVRAAHAGYYQQDPERRFLHHYQLHHPDHIFDEDQPDYEVGPRTTTRCDTPSGRLC